MSQTSANGPAAFDRLAFFFVFRVTREELTAGSAGVALQGARDQESPRRTPMTRRINFVWALSLCACGASMTAYQPVNEKTKLSSDDLFSASVKALEARDYV